MTRGEGQKSEMKPKCAVRTCAEAIASYGNLCDRHQVPGVVVHHNNRTFVVTSWYAEHENSHGIILMNDFALGELFGGVEGFRAELQRQGFGAIRLLPTPEELASAKKQVLGAPAEWGGQWMPEYPWESENCHNRTRSRSENSDRAWSYCSRLSTTDRF